MVFWTNLWSSTWQNGSSVATKLRSHKPCKYNEQDALATAGKVSTNSTASFISKLLHMDSPAPADWANHVRVNRITSWLVGFYGTSTFVGYLMLNLFYTKYQFYFKQFNLAWVHSFIVKKFLFKAIQFSQKVLFQIIQFIISIVFVYRQLNVKTVLFQAIQFSISMQFSPIWTIDRTLSRTTPPG